MSALRCRSALLLVSAGIELRKGVRREKPVPVVSVAAQTSIAFPRETRREAACLRVKHSLR